MGADSDYDFWFDTVWCEDLEEYVDELTLYAIYVETGNFEFPSHELVTRSYPEGYGVIISDMACDQREFDEDNFINNVSPDGLYAYGTEVQISGVEYTEEAVEAGYVFKDYTVYRRAVDGSIRTYYTTTSLDDVTMTFSNEGDYKEIVANYEPITYDLIVVNKTDLFGDVDGGGTYQIGDVPLPVEATIAEETCEQYFKFLGWYREIPNEPLLDSGGEHITDEQFNFIPEVVVPYPNTDVHIYAKFVAFEQEYEIDLHVALNEFGNDYPAAGDLTPTPEEGPWNCHDEVTIKATENPGYKFQHWKDADGVIYAENLEFEHIVDGDAEFTAVYEYIIYDVTVEPSPVAGGTVDGDGEFTVVDEVTVTAEEATGWEFINWTVDGIEVFTDMEYTFDMPADDIHLVANFMMIDYTVSLEAQPEEGGEVLGEGVFNYEDGVTVNAEPNLGWEFINWTEDGEEVSTDMEYTFDMPADDVHLVANFEMIEYEVTLNVYPRYDSGAVTGDGIYFYEDEVTIEAIENADGGWAFVEWIDADGNFVTDELVYEFDMPAADVEYTAVFEQLEYTVAGQVKFFGASQHLVENGMVEIIIDGESQFNRLEQTDNGLVNSYFEFTRGVDAEIDVTVKFHPDAIPFGGIGAVDALIIEHMMGGETDFTDGFDQSVHWIGAGPDYDAFAEELRDGLTPLFIIYKMLNIFTYEDYEIMDYQVGANIGNPLPGAGPEDVFEGAGREEVDEDGNYVYTGTLTLGEWDDESDDMVNIYLAVTGDMNLSFDPTISAKMAAGNLFYNGVIDAQVGEEIQIPVEVKAGDKLGAASIALDYRSDLIEITDVSTTANIQDHTVRFGWIGDETSVVITAKVLGEITDDTRLFELNDHTEIASVSASIIDNFTIETKAVNTEGETGIEDTAAEKLAVDNFPNPFSDQTTIRYTLPETAKVQVEVFNQNGQRVEVLVDENQTTGTHTVEFNRGSLSTGMYLIRVTAEGQANTYRTTNTMIITQ